MNQTALTLRAAGLGVFPCYGINSATPKAPAIPKNTSWKEQALLDPASHNWPSAIVGVPIPDGVVLLDLDTYKGVTREQIEAETGGPIPWQEAHIQTTANGGEHYAFRAPAYPCKNVSNAAHNETGIKLEGLDLRSAGKGYIATGEPYYTPTHLGGALIMAYPDALPALPEHLRPWVEYIEHQSAERVDLTDSDAVSVREALRHINPGAKREDWVQIGLALKNGFGDDPQGLSLFDEWSSGELWEGDAPENYVPDHVEGQWASFKAEGGRTIATVFYKAIENGWKPPARLDLGTIFGQNAADGATFSAVVDSIQSHGGDPRQTQDLIDMIKGLACSDMQRAMLTATLTRELKEATLLTKEVREMLSGGATGSAPTLTGTYGKADAINAQVFLGRAFPDGNVCVFDDEFYVFDKGAWRRRGRLDWLTACMARDMASVDPTGMKMSVATSSSKMAAAMLPDRDLGGAPGNLVFFRNKVLDTTNWTLHETSPEYGNMHALDFDYDPLAVCPLWEAFAHDIFDGDMESVALLQEWLGYNIVGSLRHQKIMLLLGRSRSGKGTIGKVLSHILGRDNFAGGSLTALTHDHTLNAIKNKLGYFVGDAEKNIPRNILHLVVEALKAISGGDTRTFNRKFLEAQTLTVPARITVAANHLPQLFDDSGALTGRLLLLCFQKTYLGKEDLDLDEKLKEEAPGIVNWAMAGLKRLNDNGRFTQPAVSELEMQHIRSQFSPLQDFIDECCVLVQDGGVPGSDVFNAYQSWVMKQGDDQRMTRRSFSEAFKRTAPQFEHTKRRFEAGGTPVWGFNNLSLTPGVAGNAFAPSLEVVK